MKESMRIVDHKVKFNRDNGYDDPIDIYKSNPDLINKQWLYWRNKNRYFDVGQIAICLVKIRSEYLLLTTIDFQSCKLMLRKCKVVVVE